LRQNLNFRQESVPREDFSQEGFSQKDLRLGHELQTAMAGSDSAPPELVVLPTSLARRGPAAFFRC
jgi:hypothetical protein